MNKDVILIYKVGGDVKFPYQRFSLGINENTSKSKNSYLIFSQAKFCNRNSIQRQRQQNKRNRSTM